MKIVSFRSQLHVAHPASDKLLAPLATQNYVIGQKFVGVLVYAEKCSDNNGSILLQLLCYQKLTVVHQNTMGSFEEQMSEAVRRYIHLYDSYL